MPTYKNNGTAFVTLNGNRIDPGMSYTTTFCFTSLPAGVIKTDDSPIAKQYIISREMNFADSGDSDEIDIPSSHMNAILENYTIRIICVSGGVSIKINSVSFDGELIAIPGGPVELKTRSREIVKLLFTSTADLTRIKIDVVMS